MKEEIQSRRFQKIPEDLDKAAEEYAIETAKLRQARDENFSETSYYYEAFIKGAEWYVINKLI